MRLYADQNATTLTRRLRAMDSALGDPRPVFRQLATIVRRLYAEQYRSGAGWAPNDPETIKLKGSGRVLVDTGGLARSYSTASGKYHVERITRDAMLIGSSDPVANLLKRGARGAPPRDPARLDMAQLRRRTEDTVGAYVVNGGQRRFGL